MNDKKQEGRSSLVNRVGGSFLRSLGMMNEPKKKREKTNNNLDNTKKGTHTVYTNNNKKVDEDLPTIGHKSGTGADPESWKKLTKKKKEAGWANQKDAAKKRRMTGGNIFKKNYQDRTNVSAYKFFKDDVDRVEEAVETRWPVYTRILEERKMQTSGAVAPEGLNDKTNPSGKKAIEDLTKGAVVDTTDEKGHDDVVKAGQAGPSAKPRSGGDDIKSGDKKIVK